MDVSNIVAIRNDTNKNSYLWKISVVTALTLIFAFLSGFSLGKAFLFQKFIFSSSWLTFIIFLTLFLIFFIFESLFAHSLRFWTLLLETLVFSFAFYLSRNGGKIILMSLLWSLGVWLIMLLCFWAGSFLMRRRMNDLMKLRWNDITKRGLVLALIGINLFICLQWMGNVITQLDSLFTPKTINILLQPSTPILKKYFANFDWNMMVDDFIKGVVTDQTEKLFEQNKEQLKNFPTSYIEQQKKSLIEQNSKVMKEQLSEVVGFKLQGTESLNIAAYQFLYNKYRAADLKIKQMIILIIFVLMFAILRFLAVFVNWVTRILGWLIYEILLSAGFVSVATENKIKESIILY